MPIRHNEARGGTKAAGGLRVALLADDLTGACDSAVAFAACGLPTQVGLSPASRPAATTAVWARTSESRGLLAGEVEARIGRELASLPAADLLFKKIDSVFRGNTFREIALLRRLRPEQAALLAPAFPAAGRTSHEGTLHIHDVAGTRVIDVGGELERRGVQARVVPRGLSIGELQDRLLACWESGSLLAHCEAQEQSDLDLLVEAARRVRHDVLWIGSAGLAHAVAGSLATAPPEPEAKYGPGGRVAFFVGSNHPVTLRQVLALREHARDASHIDVFEVQRGITTEADIRRMLRGHAPADLGCVFLTGGDTAMLVCRALEVDSLRVLGEFAPGLPECQAVGGTYHGVRLVLKSGGFGAERVLCEIAEHFGGARGERGSSHAAPQADTRGEVCGIR